MVFVVYYGNYLKFSDASAILARHTLQSSKAPIVFRREWRELVANLPTYRPANFKSRNELFSFLHASTLLFRADEWRVAQIERTYLDRHTPLPLRMYHDAILLFPLE